MRDGAGRIGQVDDAAVLDRLEEPDGGDVLLDGESALAMPVDTLRNRVGMVFQQFNLFSHRTVPDNLTVPLRSVHRHSKDQARQQTEPQHDS